MHKIENIDFELFLDYIVFQFVKTQILKFLILLTIFHFLHSRILFQIRLIAVSFSVPRFRF